ncbi:MAG TPA: hypothetical protein VIM58_01730 [Candidatus Methylacidiphilales bacterium]
MRIAGIAGESHIRSGEKAASFDLVAQPDELMRRKGIRLVFEGFFIEEEPLTLGVFLTDGFMNPVPVGSVHFENEGPEELPDGSRIVRRRGFAFDLTEIVPRLRGARRLDVLLKAYDVRGKEADKVRLRPGKLHLAIPSPEEEAARWKLAA